MTPLRTILLHCACSVVLISGNPVTNPKSVNNLGDDEVFYALHAPLFLRTKQFVHRDATYNIKQIIYASRHQVLRVGIKLCVAACASYCLSILSSPARLVVNASKHRLLHYPHRCVCADQHKRVFGTTHSSICVLPMLFYTQLHNTHTVA